jgi:hypothetical protein
MLSRLLKEHQAKQNERKELQGEFQKIEMDSNIAILNANNTVGSPHELSLSTAKCR